MRSLNTKLVGAFLAVSLIGTLVVAVYLARTTTVRFDRFVLDQYLEQGATRWAEYYSTHGSWEGVREAMPIPFSDRGRALKLESAPPPPSPEGVTVRRDPKRFPFVLADAQGRAVIPGIGLEIGDKISSKLLARGKPITVNGQVVGSLVIDDHELERISPQHWFIQDFYRALWIGALGATIAALLTGLPLARSLLRPIRELTNATKAMAKGVMGQRIPVRSKDELGTLAESFNQMSADLARAEQTRKQMTADIAHELRTPLSLILGHAEALSEGVLPPTGESFDIICDEAQRLVRLVEDLRTLSLSDAGELSLYREPTPPLAILEGAVAAHRPEAERRSVALEVAVDQALPLVDVDPDRIAQVVNNLLQNALRFTPPGGRIILSARLQDSAIEFSVQDSGPGIPAEDLLRVFERFYKGDKSRQRGEGRSGLGLAIARSLIRAHGGDIWAESSVGQGAIFRFTLPTTQDD